MVGGTITAAPCIIAGATVLRFVTLVHYIVRRSSDLKGGKGFTSAQTPGSILTQRALQEAHTLLVLGQLGCHGNRSIQPTAMLPHLTAFSQEPVGFNRIHSPRKSV